MADLQLMEEVVEATQAAVTVAATETPQAPEVNPLGGRNQDLHHQTQTWTYQPQVFQQVQQLTAISLSHRALPPSVLSLCADFAPIHLFCAFGRRGLSFARPWL